MPGTRSRHDADRVRPGVPQTEGLEDHSLLRLLAFLWASPITAVGLCLSLLAVATGGRLRGNRLLHGGAGHPGPGPGVSGKEPPARDGSRAAI